MDNVNGHICGSRSRQQGGEGTEHSLLQNAMSQEANGMQWGHLPDQSDILRELEC